MRRWKTSHGRRVRGRLPTRVRCTRREVDEGARPRHANVAPTAALCQGRLACSRTTITCGDTTAKTEGGLSLLFLCPRTRVGGTHPAAATQKRDKVPSG